MQSPLIATPLTATPRPVVLALIALNVLLYVIVGLSGAGWMDANGKALIEWGSNFGPLTSDGQWWRLFTAMFLHGGLVHLGVNMITLADVGSACERQYGHVRFLLLYVLAGLAGSAASVWWNPWVNSVGASGAIFGVLGALLVFMLDPRNGVPAAALKIHLTSMAVFIVYGLATGFAGSGIDNQAHIGGLIGGAIAGWALMPGARGAARAIVGVGIIALAITGLASQTQPMRAAYDTENRFLKDIEWLRGEEVQLNDEARQLFTRSRQPGVRDEELRPSAARIAERWSGAHERLSAYEVQKPSKLSEVQRNIVEFLELRRRAGAELDRAFSEPERSREHMGEYAKLMKQANAVAERNNARAKDGGKAGAKAGDEEGGKTTPRDAKG